MPNGTLITPDHNATAQKALDLLVLLVAAGAQSVSRHSLEVNLALSQRKTTNAIAQLREWIGDDTVLQETRGNRHYTLNAAVGYMPPIHDWPQG